MSAHTFSVSQGQAVELLAVVHRAGYAPPKQVRGSVTIRLDPARSLSSAGLHLTTGVADSADCRWLDPLAIRDAVITIAASGYMAEHLESPEVLLGGVLFWLALRRRV
jgi:hypothetical protein